MNSVHIILYNDVCNKIKDMISTQSCVKDCEFSEIDYVFGQMHEIYFWVRIIDKKYSALSRDKTHHFVFYFVKNIVMIRKYVMFVRI